MANRFRRLTEGFTSDVVTGIRQFFARSPEMQALDLQRGGIPTSGRAGLPFSMASQFGMDSLAQHLQSDQSLQARYTDAEEMDEYGTISAAYDLYADDSAMPDMERGQSIWVASDNKTVENDLNEMLHKKVLIEEHIWGLERTISKYGNSFAELLVSDQGVVGLNFCRRPPCGAWKTIRGGCSDSCRTFVVSLI